METPTTLVAVRADTGARVTIGDVPLERLRVLSDARLLRCPGCGAPLTLKAGPVRIHHFAHAGATLCAASEPETESHRAGKLLLYRHFRVGALAAEVEHHLPATDQRVDVYIEQPDARYALEFQQANNAAAEWVERHARYTGQGLVDIWFLGQSRYQEAASEALHPISPYDPHPVPRDAFDAAAGAFRVREIERAILDTFSGCPRRFPALHYLDPDSGMLTILLARDVRHNTLRAYRYRLPIESCTLRDGWLWTPLDPLLADYRARQRNE
jgi:hypothetical protein